ncbi:MAG: lysozyme [Acidiferrobacteraceae bacterium]
MADPALSIACTLAARFEGCSMVPYQDACGVWTIGRGTTIIPGTGERVCATTAPITAATANVWLEDEMKIALNAVDRFVKTPINVNQRAALADFVYNCGATAFSLSTLLEIINAGINDKYDGARCATQLLRWVHDRKGDVEPGLVTRRKAEADLFCASVESPEGKSNV